MSLAPIDFIETNEILTNNEKEIKKEEYINDVPESERNLLDGDSDKSKCGEIFAVHSGNFILICAFCNAHFDNMQMFGMHIQRQHKSKISPIALRTTEFNTSNYSDDSQSVESDEMKSESDSDSQHFSQDEWAARSHQTDADEAAGPGFTCDTCTQEYKSKKTLRQHQRSTGCKQKLPPADLALFCIPCNRQFKSKRKFQRHKQKHKDGQKTGSMCNSMGGEINSGNLEHNQQQLQQHQHYSTAAGNSVVVTNQQDHTQMHYQRPRYTSQLTTVNNLVNSYSQTVPIETTMDQTVYGLAPIQSPVLHHMTTRGNSSGAPQKRKRSPQSDENFIQALEAVRTGGIGFCKAARIYGVNNRTLWLEYKKRGYPVSRPSIMNRNKVEPDISPPPPSSTPAIEKSTMDIYEHINQPSINMQVPPTSEASAPIMCPPQAHPIGLMSFLDTRHLEFPASIHTMMSRQRFNDSTVHEDTGAMNLHDPDFNSM